MILSGMNESVITERGQVSVPAELRRSMGLHAGQKLRWERISDLEIRVSVRDEAPTGPISVLGFARQIHNGPPRRTEDWMKELREGE